MHRLISVLGVSILLLWRLSKLVKFPMFSTLESCGYQVLPCIIAQQEAQRAQFIVEKAKQERQEKVVRAEGEAEAARMIS